MVRYYFNIRRDETVFEDRAGVLLPGLADAWKWALRDALQLVRDGHIDRRQHKYWIEVCDSTRSSVLIFPIGPMTEQ